MRSASAASIATGTWPVRPNRHNRERCPGGGPEPRDEPGAEAAKPGVSIASSQTQKKRVLEAPGRKAMPESSNVVERPRSAKPAFAGLRGTMAADTQRIGNRIRTGKTPAQAEGWNQGFHIFFLLSESSAQAHPYRKYTF